MRPSVRSLLVDTSARQSESRPVLPPGPDHPIRITPTPSRVQVRVGDVVVAESANALTLQESNYPGVQYLPRRDVTAELRPTSTTSYCPYKGDCSYYTLVVGDTEVTDAIWTYAQPYPAVAEIGGYLAFYSNKVTISVE
jgi:uncharacterized protein (DUF427 family)